MKNNQKLLHDLKSLSNKFEMIGDELTIQDLIDKSEVYQDLILILKESSDMLKTLND